ncbi:hypothetical protein B0H34DRAFT_545507 [Crassisporium funariophilum]|nr:hypothetical protein B0H34DRAFT_544645 [Crassisporium funariophilum]KAF8154942.1 hypothetical protein B0H34DRAFT_545507 [Crassisporium funariophilum]
MDVRQSLLPSLAPFRLPEPFRPSPCSVSPPACFNTMYRVRGFAAARRHCDHDIMYGINLLPPYIPQDDASKSAHRCCPEASLCYDETSLLRDIALFPVIVGYWPLPGHCTCTETTYRSPAIDAAQRPHFDIESGTTRCIHSPCGLSCPDTTYRRPAVVVAPRRHC